MAFAQETNVLPSTTKTLENSYFQNISSDASTQDRGRVISANQILAAEILLPPIKNLDKLKRSTNCMATIAGFLTFNK